jgi:hypothetical protein
VLITEIQMQMPAAFLTDSSAASLICAAPEAIAFSADSAVSEAPPATGHGQPAELSGPKQVPLPSLPTDSEQDINNKHTRLQKNIKKLRSGLLKKETILTNAKAAASVLDLEALAQFNDKARELSLKRLKMVKSLHGASRLRRPQIKRKIQACNPTLEASLAISHRCGKGEYYARFLRSMATHVLTHGVLPERDQGKGAHHESLLLVPAVSEALQEWVKGTLAVEEGGFVGRVILHPIPFNVSDPPQMRPAKMRRYVNDFLLPELKIEETISESTAMRWLKRMGFRLARVQKGVYVDGHERPDVVESRDKLIEYLWLHVFPSVSLSLIRSLSLRFFRFCYKYEEKKPEEETDKGGEPLKEIAPQLQPGEKIHYVLTHDECCVHANDQVN